LLIAATSAASLSAQQYSVLVFAKTTGFRHSSIPNGIAAIWQLGAKNGFSVTATDDSSVFTAANLAKYKAVIFLNTTGDILDADQKAAFEAYIHKGGGFAGVHAATDTEYKWPFYGKLVGAYFLSHPKIQTATVNVTDRTHPSTAALPATISRTDEWYNFRVNPRPEVHVLAVVDEKSYTGGTMDDHPVAWCHEFEGGRAWYTAMGHTEESYTEPLFLDHLLGGIQSAAGVAAANCAVSRP
jgi:type 1 glutamine amidotransferase